MADIPYRHSTPWRPWSLKATKMFLSCSFKSKYIFFNFIFFSRNLRYLVISRLPQSVNALNKGVKHLMGTCIKVCLIFIVSNFVLFLLFICLKPESVQIVFYISAMATSHQSFLWIFQFFRFGFKGHMDNVFPWLWLYCIQHISDGNHQLTYILGTLYQFFNCISLVMNNIKVWRSPKWWLVDLEDTVFSEDSPFVHVFLWLIIYEI